jgi:hypothetical protein
VGAVLFLGVVAFGTASLVLAHFGGDNAPTSVQIVNETSEPLIIYLVDVAGRRTELLVVGAHGTGNYFDPCAAAELVAVGPNGADVAQRPASDECNLIDWTIPGSAAVSPIPT